jgi:hypothetical protein
MNERERLILEILAQKEEPAEPWSHRQPGCPPVASIMDVALGRADSSDVLDHCDSCSSCGVRLKSFQEAMVDAQKKG